MSVKLSPVFNGQVVTSNGAPASGYFIYTYAAGSTTLQPTYTDSSGGVSQENPIELNSLGRADNPIWLTAGLSYKFIVKDADNVQVGNPYDNISGVNDASTSTSQWQASGVTPTYIGSTSFSLSGDQTSEFHVGRRLQFTTTGGTVYGTLATSAYTTLTIVTMVMDPGDALDSGLSAVNLSILRADKEALPAYIKFPGTQISSSDPNTLDDYEEGTWTGALLCGGSGTITMGNSTGTYTKTGNVVTVTGIFDVAAVSSPLGTLALSGIPFAAGNNNRNYAAASLRVASTNAVGTPVMWQAYIVSNTSEITIEYMDTSAGSVGSNAAAQVKASTSFTISATYMTN